MALIYLIPSRMLCVILFLSMLIFNYWVIDLVDLNGLIDLAYLLV